MNKRLIIFFLILSSIASLAGCGKTNAGNKDNNEHAEIDSDEREAVFPSDYSQESEKITFNCKIEVSDDFTRDNTHKTLVSGQFYADSESIMSNYVEGREILEEHDLPVDQGMPEEKFYMMADGSEISIGSQFVFTSKDYKYYSYVGAMDSTNREEYSTGQVSFASAEDAIEAVKQEMTKIGYSALDFKYESYPLSYEAMEKIEQQYINDGYMQEKQKKDTWTQEDDAYIVYAYQINETLPIFHELMSINRMMAYDTSDNAPVQAVYSTRGIESLVAGPVYNFENTDEVIVLNDFTEIADVVKEKFESILNDAHYVVNRAKLFQMVSLDQNQKYAAEPIWYFEVIENDSSKSVVLVNAVTGKEIFLN